MCAGGCSKRAVGLPSPQVHLSGTTGGNLPGHTCGSRLGTARPRPYSGSSTRIVLMAAATANGAGTFTDHRCKDCDLMKPSFIAAPLVPACSSACMSRLRRTGPCYRVHSSGMPSPSASSQQGSPGVLPAIAAGMLGLSFLSALLQAVQAKITRGHDGLACRLVVAALCYAQPLVRSWTRYRTRLFAYRPPVASSTLPPHSRSRLPIWGQRTEAYWTGDGYERTELLGLVVAYLNEHSWGKAVDSGWKDWDLEVYCHPWTVIQVSTAQEDLGGPKRVIRVRIRCA